MEKLSRPRLHKTLPRQRLFHQLDELRASPGIWVSARAGAGKTTLLSSYCEARNLPALWYRLDSGDTDPASFYFHLRLAAQAFGPGADALPAFTPDFLPDAEGFARRFCRQLFALLPEHVLLVFDDWHENLTRALGSVIRIMVEELPAGRNVVFISRLSPPRNLTRMLANQRVSQLWPNDLVLSPDESLAIALDQGLHDSDLAAQMHTESEGWMAGLILLASAAGQPGGKAPTHRALARKLVFDYFASEVFDFLLPPTRRLLLSTSLLPTFTSQSAVEVSGDPGAAEVLEDLYRSHGFLAREDGAHGHYRYHDLFRDFLAQRLKSDASASQRVEWLHLSVEVLKAQGDVDAALSLLCVQRDWEGAGELLKRVASETMVTGRWKTFERWIGMLPAKNVQADPWLTYWQGIGTVPISVLDARKMFARAYDCFEAAGDRRGQFKAAIGCLECIVAQLSSYQDLDPWLARVQTLLQIGDGDSAADDLDAWYAFLYGALCRDPGQPMVDVGIARLRVLLHQKHLSPTARLRVGVILILYCCITADHALAEDVIGIVQPLSTQLEMPPVPRWLWSFWLGYYYMWRIQYERCTACWHNCFEVSRQHNLQALDFLPEAAMAMVDLVEDRIGSAEQRLGRIRPLVAHGQEIAEGFYWLVETFRRVLRNRRDEIPQAIEQLLRHSYASGLFPLQILSMTDVAALLLLEGRDDEAMKTLDAVRERIGSAPARLVEGQLHAIESVLSFRRGARSEGHASLQLALSASEKSGTCGCLLWIRPGFSALFDEALSAGLQSEYVLQLIHRYQIPAPSSLTLNWPWPVRIRSFGTLDVQLAHGSPSLGKSRHKVLEMLKALIIDGARDSSVNHLADTLWPDAEGDTAQNNLRGTVKRLREWMGHAAAVRHFDGKLSLNDRTCWLDTHALERLAEEISEAPHQRAVDGQQWESMLFDIYRGPFLRAETLVGVEARRDVERRRLARALQGLERVYRTEGRRNEMKRLQQRALEVDSRVVDFFL